MDEKYRITKSLVVGVAADGITQILYLEGFFHSSNLSYLPKTNVAEGSNFFASDTADVYFFSEYDSNYHKA